MYYTILYYATLYCTVTYATLYCNVMYYAMLCYAMIYYNVPCGTRSEATVILNIYLYPVLVVLVLSLYTCIHFTLGILYIRYYYYY